ncbi:MAG: insulinase family protein [Oscillospiraceae bacterium]|jgi:predicted Zn-dependent peptidase|nr:insulinase family protein [Oscillospiraceae bacterium]
MKTLNFLGLNRKEIASGIYFSKITDARFKHNRVSFCLLTRLDENAASANAVVPKILTNSCRDYPDLRALNKRLSSLYAARLSESVGNLGDTQYIDISIKTADDRYALEGESILSEGIDILAGCLLEPLTENGAFKESVTENEKRSQIDQIEAELNEKRVYVIKRTLELLCAGEPAAVPPNGTVEGVKKVTPLTAFAAYKKLLESARIEIICVGCNDFSVAETTLTRAVSRLKRNNTEDCVSKPGALKPETLYREEKMNVNQSKMALGFKAAGDDVDALAVMTKIYGGSATSKLFENVREKMSLCYYCLAKFDANKRIMLAECGVESGDIEKARKEILAQLDLMKTGGFTDEEMSHAGLSLQNDLKTVGDSLSGMAKWYLGHIYMRDVVTPEQAIARYLAVTRERIIKAAESVSLDTVYVLTERDTDRKGRRK